MSTKTSEKIVLVVLMPLYNQGAYLAQAIESVLRQRTNFGYKLIIIDDGSTDESLMIAKKYQQKFPQKVMVIAQNRNQGLYPTIRRGYQELLGVEYFAVLDPDDYYLQVDKLQKAVNYLHHHSEYAAYTTNSEVRETNGEKKFFLEITGDQSFTMNDFLRRTVTLGHTSATVFRNKLFFDGLAKSGMKKKQTKKWQAAHRGDAWRNLAHLCRGKIYVSRDCTSVYRQTKKGLWTKLSVFEQNNLNANFNLQVLDELPVKFQRHFSDQTWKICVDNWSKILTRECPKPSGKALGFLVVISSQSFFWKLKLSTKWKDSL